MKEIIYDTEYEDESVVPSKSTRNFEIKIKGLPLIINEIENFTPNTISYKSNFTKEEYSASQSFQKKFNMYYLKQKIKDVHGLK